MASSPTGNARFVIVRRFDGFPRGPTGRQVKVWTAALQGQAFSELCAALYNTVHV